MAFDYSGVAATAVTLIEQFGRQVTLVQLDSTPADSGKPWRGASDPEATPDNTESVYAAWVPPSSASELGLSTMVDFAMVQRMEAILIIPATTADISTFDQVLDGTTRYTIEFTEVLKPGPTVVLQFVGVKK